MFFPELFPKNMIIDLDLFCGLGDLYCSSSCVKEDQQTHVVEEHRPQKGRTSGTGPGYHSCLLQDEGLPPLILDDPGTPEPSDYWLHPCDCAPPAWSTGAPVNAEKFEEQPAESQNDSFSAVRNGATGAGCGGCGLF